jgi:hypothetical protein
LTIFQRTTIPDRGKEYPAMQPTRQTPTTAIAAPLVPHIVGQNVDTFISNARLSGDFPDELARHLDELKTQSQGTEEDIPTPWRFAGEVLFIKPHGAGRQWRWILHSPSLHLDVGLGRLTHIVAKARLSAALLWEHEIGVALTLLYGFLADSLLVDGWSSRGDPPGKFGAGGKATVCRECRCHAASSPT